MGGYELKRWGIVRETFSPNVAYIDLDVGRRLPRYHFFRLLSRLRLIGLRVKWISYYRTRKGWHVEFFHGANLSPAETVALQAILGSDEKREALNLMRALSLARRKYPEFWRKRFNVLYGGKLK